jgi:tetratricopeptide (TPR) repeat protein
MVLALAGTASANDRSDCTRTDDVDRAIRACTNIIAVGGQSRDNLAIAYRNRGIAYEKASDYDRAIADYNKAIELNPQFAETYVDRGVAFSNKGNYDHAARWVKSPN